MQTHGPIDEEARSAVDALLEPGEEVEWCARPDESAFCRLRPRLLILGVFWLLLAGSSFFGFGVTFLGEGFTGVALPIRVLVFSVAAAPFLAVGLFAIGGHVPVFRWAWRRTAYAVTSQRVLLVRPFFRVTGAQRMRELPRDRVGGLVVDPDDTGGGDLEIHDRAGVEAPFRFQFLPDPDSVAARLGTNPDD